MQEHQNELEEGSVNENSQPEEKKDFNDLLFPDRVQYKGLGPIDCAWPEEQPVTIIQLSRPTNHDGEAIQVSIPVFKNDTDVELNKRFHVLTAIGDHRFRENNRALQTAQVIEREERQKAELDKVAHQVALKAVKKSGKKPLAEV
jgi:predicted transcriptional regulator